MVDSLDLGDLEGAVATLDRALALAADRGRIAILGVDGPMIVMTHAIKAFELAYETGVKALTRRLEIDNPEQSPRTLPYNDRIRLAADQGLLRDSRPWFRFRELRNRTVHTYHVRQATAVMGEIPAFAEEARHLLAALQSRNA